MSSADPNFSQNPFFSASAQLLDNALETVLPTQTFFNGSEQTIIADLENGLTGGRWLDNTNTASGEMEHLFVGFEEFFEVQCVDKEEGPDWEKIDKMEKGGEHFFQTMVPAVAPPLHRSNF